MHGAWCVLTDVIREAVARRWVLGLWVVTTLVLAIIAFGIRLEVVDGALSAAKLFGLSRAHKVDIQSIDVALRPAFQAASYLVFYVGLPLSVLAFADFAPRLMAPGRIEHLLSLPLNRASLLGGTFLGVWIIALGLALYATGGFTLILGLKTGVYEPRLMLAGLMAWLVFGATYGGMITATVMMRSATASSLTGFALLVLGIAASYQYELAPVFSSEWAAAFVGLVLSPIPPVADLAADAAALTGHLIGDPAATRRLAATSAFAAAMLAIGVWQFERKDY